jgi:DNA-directed RNA polymerase specialized sigma24 family protein
MTATNDRTIEHTKTPSETTPDHPHPPNTPPTWHDDFAQQRANYHAERLTRQYHLKDNDKEDIRQELFLRVHRKQRGYDPRRSSPHTFTSRAFDWAAGWIERDLCQDRRRATRLWAVRRCLIQRASWRRGPCPPPGAKTAMTELLEAIDRLPDDQRELAMCLMTGTPTQAARTLGVNRSTVYRRLNQLREALAHHAPDLPATP